MRGLIHVVHSLPEEVAHIAVINVVKSVFFTIVGVFLPLMIYAEFGFEKAVIFLFLSLSVFYIFSTYVAKKLVYKVGIERTQILGLLSLFLASTTVYFCKNIFILAVLYSFSQAFYWIPKHLCFGLFGRRKEVVEELTVTDVLGMVASMLTPLASAVFVFLFGFELLFTVSSIFLLFVLFILWGKYRKKRTPAMIRKGLKIPKKFYFLFSLEGVVVGLNIVVFILFLYSFSSNILDFGLFRTLGLLISIFLAIPLSFFIDRRHEFALSSMGYLLSAYALLFGFFTTDIIPFIIVILLSMSPLRDLPFVGFLYKEAKKYGGELIVKRAILLGSFRASVLISLLMPANVFILLTTFAYIAYAFLYYFVAKPEE